jgi:hypothetical protein
MIRRLADVAMLGMTRPRGLRAKRWHHTGYVSGLVDTATGRLLDAGRAGDQLLRRPQAGLKAGEDLHPRGWYRLAAGMQAGDPEGR